MSEQDDDSGTAAPREGEAARPAVDSNLSDLRARLDELQQSVEQLGSQDFQTWSQTDEPESADAGPEAAPYGESPPQYAQPPPASDEPPSRSPYEQPPAYGEEPYEPSPYEPPTYELPAYEPSAFEPPPPPPIGTPHDPSSRGFPAQAGSAGEPDPWAQPIEPEPLTYPAPPAATNGHGNESVDPAEISARSATVAMVEAGPFADLIELRHFEDDLAALEAVRDVRVRRFGQGRATIEVGMTGPYLLSRELYQLNRPMEVADGPDGEIVIELAPLPERDVPEFLPRTDEDEDTA